MLSVATSPLRVRGGGVVTQRQQDLRTATRVGYGEPKLDVSCVMIHNSTAGKGQLFSLRQPPAYMQRETTLFT